MTLFLATNVALGASESSVIAKRSYLTVGFCHLNNMYGVHWNQSYKTALAGAIVVLHSSRIGSVLNIWNWWSQYWNLGLCLLSRRRALKIVFCLTKCTSIRDGERCICNKWCSRFSRGSRTSSRGWHKAEKEDLLCLPRHKEAERRVHCPAWRGRLREVDRGPPAVLKSRRVQGLIPPSCKL